jgi:hypothetical protein
MERLRPIRRYSGDLSIWIIRAWYVVESFGLRSTEPSPHRSKVRSCVDSHRISVYALEAGKDAMLLSGCIERYAHTAYGLSVYRSGSSLCIGSNTLCRESWHIHNLVNSRMTQRRVS